MQFAPGTTPIAVDFVFLKSNHLVIFSIIWFAKFNFQIDWHNHSVSLDLHVEQHTIVFTYAADIFAGIDLYIAD